MKTKNVLSLLLLVTAAALTGSCSKDKDDDNNGAPAPVAKSRNIKYEITGNYTGTFTIVYTNPDGVTESLTDIPIPWSKEVTVRNDVHSVGFSASSTVATPGRPGEKATARLYVGGKQEKQASQTAGEDGLIIFGTLFYYY